MKRREPDANFDLVARPYHSMEYLTFGRALERCRNHFLPQLADCRSVLVFGDGDGRFVARLLTVNPALHADAVDSSRTMLHLLKRRAQAAVGPAPKLRTYQTSALAFKPDRRYDLVVTHFFLDCLTTTEIQTLCARIRPHLEPRARWVVSDFRIPAGPMRWPATAIVRLLYLAFRLLTGLRITHLPDHAAAFVAAGLTRASHHRSLAGLLTSEMWEYTPAMQLPPQRPRIPHIPDPVPDPEPATPSLSEPDPGVFHPEPDPRPQPQPHDPTGSSDEI
jgi:ubiquinone/menaquinone biosynthesis C-methylase UbiE